MSRLALGRFKRAPDVEKLKCQHEGEAKWVQSDRRGLRNTRLWWTSRDCISTNQVRRSLSYDSATVGLCSGVRRIWFWGRL